MAGPKSARVSKTNSQEQVNFIFVSSAHLFKKKHLYNMHITVHTLTLFHLNQSSFFISLLEVEYVCSPMHASLVFKAMCPSGTAFCKVNVQCTCSYAWDGFSEFGIGC